MLIGNSLASLGDTAAIAHAAPSHNRCLGCIAQRRGHRPRSRTSWATSSAKEHNNQTARLAPRGHGPDPPFVSNTTPIPECAFTLSLCLLPHYTGAKFPNNGNPLRPPKQPVLATGEF